MTVKANNGTAIDTVESYVGQQKLLASAKEKALKLDDVEFVKHVRTIEAAHPFLYHNTDWRHFIARELQFRLLVKGQ